MTCPKGPNESETANFGPTKDVRNVRESYGLGHSDMVRTSAPPTHSAGTVQPDWLTAQAKAIATARPKKPRSAYVRRWR
jgi:hypothetical protein